MFLDYDIKPVHDMAEAYAVAFIVGQQIAVTGVAENKKCDIEKASQRVSWECAQNPRFGMFAAYKKNGAAIGYICGELREDLYTGETCAFELLWVCIDAVRNCGVGPDLLSTWEEFCKSRGCVRSYMGLNINTQPDIVRKVYSRRGYKLHSESYEKTL